MSWLILYWCVSCRDKRYSSHFCLISVSEGLYATRTLFYSFWRFDSHPTPSLWEAGGKCTCLKVSSQLKLGKQAESSSGLFHNQLSMTSVETQEISLPSPVHILKLPDFCLDMMNFTNKGFSFGVNTWNNNINNNNN